MSKNGKDGATTSSQAKPKKREVLVDKSQNDGASLESACVNQTDKGSVHLGKRLLSRYIIVVHTYIHTKLFYIVCLCRAKGSPCSEEERPSKGP